MGSIKKASRLSAAYIKNNIRSGYFLLSVLLFAGLMYFSTHSEIGKAESGAWYFLRFAYTNGTTSYLLPVVCAISSSLMFCREIRNGLFVLTYFRTGKRSYAFALCLAGAVTAFTVAIVGSMLYLAAISGTVSLIGGNEHTLHNAILAYANGQLMAEGNYILYYMITVLTQASFCAFMAAVTVLSSTFLQDPYLTIVSPMVIYIVITNGLRIFGATRLVNPYYVFSSLNYMYLSLHPPDGMEEIINFSMDSCLYPFVYAIVGIITCALLTYAALYKKTERNSK